MSTKKVSYTKLLQEAMADFDTTKTVDVSGPMTKQIIGYKGDGELKTTSDAASILERFYFKQEDEGGVSVIGEDDRTDFAEPDRNDVSDVPDKNISKTKKDIEKAVKEGDDSDEDEDKDKAVKEGDDSDEAEDKDKEEKDVNESDLSEAEEAVIEKLISEMEEDEGEDEDEEDKDKKIDESVKEQDEELDVDDEGTDTEVEVDEMGPVGNPKNADEDDLSEAYKIFREEIETDDVDDIDSDDIKV